MSPQRLILTCKSETVRSAIGPKKAAGPRLAENARSVAGGGRVKEGLRSAR